MHRYEIPASEDTLNKFKAIAPVVLNDLLTNPKSRTNAGICAIIANKISKEVDVVLSEEVCHIVSTFAKDWQYHSGSFMYPVPASEKEAHKPLAKPAHAYARFKALNALWKGEQLKLRLALIRHLLKKLESL